VCAFAVSLLIENRFHVNGDGHNMNEGKAGPWSNTLGSWRMGGLEGRNKKTIASADGNVITDDSKSCVNNRDGSFDMFVSWKCC
jgi:hypothetical protein